MFGWFDVGLYTLITSKFKLAYQVVDPKSDNPDTDRSHQNYTDPNISSQMPTSSNSAVRGRAQTQMPIRKDVRERLQKMVREILGEIMNEDMASSISDTSSTADTLPTATNADDQEKTSGQVAQDKNMAIKNLQATELQAKQDKQQRDSYATTVKNYDQIKRKADREAINTARDNLRKASTPSTSKTTATATSTIVGSNY